jgi:hypothetical protein
MIATNRRRFWERSAVAGAAPPALFLRHWLVAQASTFTTIGMTRYASRGFLTLAADSAGRRRLQLPRRSDLSDSFADERLWRGLSRFW